MEEDQEDSSLQMEFSTQQQGEGFSTQEANEPNSLVKVDWDQLEVQPIEGPFETFKGDSIVAGDTPPIDRDWTPLFKNDTMFESRDALKSWIQEFGKMHRMVIVVIKSDFSKGRNPRIMFGCDRGGTYKPSKKAKCSEEGGSKLTGTKKCGCPFSIKTTKHPFGEDNWVISEVVCGKHNHPLSPYVEGLPYHARLTPEEQGFFVDLSKGGVKPKVALAILKDRNPENSSSLQTLYNLKKKLRKDEMDERTEMQQLLMLADKAGYVISERREPESDIVRNLFFAHPDSISLAKCFPYVFMMDSTYKTNIHKWPLFEIVGMTSTMKTFSVCYCFMEHETMDNFRWALERFKELLFDDQVPVTMVTDRELALMNAIELVFPKTTHILCRWHIAMGIEKKGKAVLPKDGEDPEGALKKKWRSMWDEVVYSHTMSEYTDRLAALENEWKDWPALYEYASSWLEYKEKFVSVWTDQVFHLGNIATSRVEGAHASLKDSLYKTCKHTFLSMYMMIDKSLGVQMAEIKRSFTLSLNNHHHDHRIALFRDLRGSTSSECLKLLKAAYDKWMQGYSTPEKCGCALKSTHGLPCACRVGTIVGKNQSLSLADLHPFWRKLSVQPRRVEVDDLEQHEEFVAWVARYKTASSDQKKYMLRRLRDDAWPQSTWLSTPTAPVKGKGRPSKKKPRVDWSTKRDPSAFELPVSPIPTPPPGQFYSLGTSTSSSQQPKAKKKVRTESMRFRNEIPMGYEHFVEDIIDVPGDGNCGFRAIAKGLNLPDSDGWKTVRKDCLLELDHYRSAYAYMFGGDDEITKLRKIYDHFESPTERPPKYWMLMPETGYLVANFYRVVVVYLSKRTNMMLTFAPQHSRPPPVEDGKAPSILCLCLMHVQDGKHFVCVKLTRFAPIPPPTTFFTRFRQPSALAWDDVLRVRVDGYMKIFKDKFATNDRDEVIPLCLSD